MRVQYSGRVDFADMHVAFPYQVQPEINLVDFLHVLPTGQQKRIDKLHFDYNLRCAYPKPLLVPHHQYIKQEVIDGGLTVVDRNKAQNVDIYLPTFQWDTLTLKDESDNNVASNCTVQQHAERNMGFQYTTVHVKEAGDPYNTILRAGGKAFRREVTFADEQDLDAQGFIMFISQSLWTKSDPSKAEPGFWAVDWYVNGYLFRLWCGKGQTLQLQQMEWNGLPIRVINGNVKTGSSIASTWNDAMPDDLSKQIMVEVLVMNGRMSVNVNGAKNPIVLDLGFQATSSVVGTQINSLLLAQGDATDFPPTSYSTHPTFGAFPKYYVYAWQTGQPLMEGNYTRLRVANRLTLEENGEDALATDEGDISPVKKNWNVGILDPRITRIGVHMRYFSQASFSCHLLKFPYQCEFESAPKQLGFSPDISTPTYFTIYDGVSATTADSLEEHRPILMPDAKMVVEAQTTTESYSQYKLTVTTPPYNGDLYMSYMGQQYSDYAPCITRISTRIDGIAEEPVYAAQASATLGEGDCNYIREIVENIAFDPNALTIRHTCDILMDNWYGIGNLTNLYGITASGNIGTRVQLGYTVPDMGIWNRFYGYCDTYVFNRPSSNQATVTLRCVDMMQRLSETYIAAPPNFDGMNHYYAVSLVLQLAGFTKNQMAFKDYVPDDPFTHVEDIDPYPYFLPMGAGFRPWTPINRVLSALELLDMIRKVTGFLFFQNADGMIEYFEWIPDADASPKRVFTEVYTQDANNGLTEIYRLGAMSSTRNTKNVVSILGIDAESPNWDKSKLGGVRQDLDSISSPPGLQPRNYIGYKKPFIWIDSRFANRGFMERALERLYRFLRLPEYTITFDCWLQPDLYPLDVIHVNDSRSNSNNVPFYIMSMANKLSIHSGRIEQSSTITGRFLDAQALAEGV